MTESERVRDEWLALRCQAGEPRAFEDLVRTLERPLFYFASKLTGNQEIALEVLQEVWLRASRSMRSLREPRSVRSWLYRLTYGIAIDHVRSEHRRSAAEAAHSTGRSGADDSETFRAVEAAEIHRALDRLDPGPREVLTLYFLEEFTTREIAGILDVPEGTVKSRLHYAKKALRDLLTQGAKYV
jgi:RNA polymerase sigma-70 factor, ECF subfamily